MDIFGNMKYPQTAKRLLNQLNIKELTLKDFLMECAYWALKDGFDELYPKPYPTPPNTEAFREYESLSLERKLKVNYDFFYKHPEINEYYQQKNFIKNHNNATLLWLKELQGYVPEGDSPSHQKIKNRILEFQAFLDDISPSVEKAKEVFDGSIVD